MLHVTHLTCVVGHAAVEAGLAGVGRGLVEQLQRPPHLLHVERKPWNKKCVDFLVPRVSIERKMGYRHIPLRLKFIEIRAHS